MAFGGDPIADRKAFYFAATGNDFAAKFSVVYDSVVTGEQHGALVRFTTAVAPGEAEADADARLQAFMAEALLSLPRFVP